MKATGPSARHLAGLARRGAALLLAAVVLLVTPTPIQAAPAGGEDLAALLVDNAAIRFAPKVRPQRWVLQVTGAEGVVLQRELPGEALSALAIPRSGEEGLPDGHYTYSLYAVFEHGAPRQVQAGGFVVGNGAVTLPTPGAAPPISLSAALGVGLSAAGAAPMFDFVINDDLVVLGSTCIGFDCVNNVPFSFTTLALAENNLRMMFHDTSTVASYPRRDWELEANSSANGGSAHFAIIDCGDNGSVSSCPLGNRVFLVEGGAPANSLRVDNSGRVGVGTGNPVLEIHINNNDTPALRLQQNGNGGWAPQTWDVAGNETSFFIRDATNGSTLPFRIRPAAPSNALVIDDEGVGVGTLSPGAQLDIRSADSGRTALSMNMPASPSASALSIGVDGSPRVEFMSGGAVAEAMRVHLLDNGSGPGPYFFLRRNSNASTPAAASIVMEAITGLWAIWVDDSANLRIGNQVGVSNANDTAGTVVGTQTSWFEAKTDIAPWDFRGALGQVVDLPLYSFRFENDSQRGDKLNHGLVVFEQDRDAWWVMNAAPNQTPVLDEANLFGHLIGAIKELDAEVAERDRAIDELTRRIEALEAALQRVAAGADGSR